MKTSAVDVHCDMILHTNESNNEKKLTNLTLPWRKPKIDERL